MDAKLWLALHWIGRTSFLCSCVGLLLRCTDRHPSIITRFCTLLVSARYSGVFTHASYIILHVVCNKKVQLKRCKGANFKSHSNIRQNFLLMPSQQLDFHLCLNVKVAKKQQYFFSLPFILRQIE